MSNIEPTNRSEFEALAIECRKQKATNLRRLIDLWHTYLMQCETMPHDIRQDPGSKLVIALLATQVGLGIHRTDAPREAADEIRRARN